MDATEHRVAEPRRLAMPKTFDWCACGYGRHNDAPCPACHEAWYIPISHICNKDGHVWYYQRCVCCGARWHGA